MIHTIVETMRYLATDFLGATEPNSVKIFTTGHSLGGAMCSNFAYLWMGIKKIAPYNSAPYNVLADNIICMSLGAPRCMGSSVANKFCNFVSQKKILFLRITTRGDPVPALPPKTGFQHPCSDDSKMRKEVSEDCNAQLTMRPTPSVNYKGDLDCQNYKTRAFITNPISHTIYLDILYTKAVDIVKFFKGIGTSQEVLRGQDNSTICRLVMGQSSGFKAIFFDVNKARETPTTIDAVEEVELQKADPNMAKELEAGNESETSSNIVGGRSMFSSYSSYSSVKPPTMKIGGSVAEDKRMTLDAFNTLVKEMVPLTGDLCPVNGQMSNPFNNKIMPNLSCPKTQVGGKRRTKKYKKSKKKRGSKKMKKIKKRKSRK